MTVNPQNIDIICNGRVIGMVQSINPQESRAVTKITALGYEGVITSAPSNYQGGTFLTPMIMIYDQSSLEAFGIVDNGGRLRGGLRSLPKIISLKQQRIPLDIVIVTSTPVIGAESVTTYVRCWITSFGQTFQTNGTTIAENIGWSYDDVIVS